MKIAKIFTGICMLLLLSFQANAESVVPAAEKEKLIQLMANDQDVASLSLQTLALALVQQAGMSPAEVALTDHKLHAAMTESAKKIAEKYPLFVGMSREEKLETMQEVSKQMFDGVTLGSEMPRVFTACQGSALLGLAACVGIAGSWSIVKFFACMGSAIMVDTIIDIASDGLAIELTYQELRVETQFCGWITKNDFAISTGVLVSCVADLVQALISCLAG